MEAFTKDIKQCLCVQGKDQDEQNSGKLFELTVNKLTKWVRNAEDPQNA